jgi:hypothetical protein
MKTIKKHRKIFYVPGMISLVILPVLLLVYISQNKFLEEEYAIDLGLPDATFMDKHKKEYGFIFQRNYKIFNFNGTLKSNESTLRKFQLALKHQNKNRDTINGLKLLLGKKMTYEVYIRILDILTLEETPTYMDYENVIWIINGNPKKRMAVDSTNYTMNCSTQYYTYQENQRLRKEEMVREQKVFMTSYIKGKWFLFVFFFGLVILNVFTLIKFNTNKKYDQKSYL